jgi:H+/Cl- antiporter ClcA
MQDKKGCISKMNIVNSKQKHQKIQVQLVWEGLLIGVVAGGVVVLYRIALAYDKAWLSVVLNAVRENPVWIIGWFFLLFLLALLTGYLMKWEPHISGSGLPQLKGELLGVLDQDWKKVLPAKFIGGVLALTGGLSLGRGGPSMQLGAMTGKGLSRILKWDKETEKQVLICGASAGFAAAFHAPLAGVIFIMEEIQKGFSVMSLIPMLVSAVSADCISVCFLGREPVFRVVIEAALPRNEYWLLLPLGIVLGVTGVLYQRSLMGTKRLYQKVERIGEKGKMMVVFMTAGILGIFVPEVLGSGGILLQNLTNGNMVFGTLLFLLAMKFLFTMLSAASGVPGGLFLPLFVLGAMLGSIFAVFGVRCLGLDSIYINNFIFLAIAGYFAAIFRTPVTGIILVCEALGSFQYILALGIVSVVSYITARLLRSEAIGESLLKDLLEGQKKK